MKNVLKMIIIIMFVNIVLRIVNIPISLATNFEYGLTGAQFYLLTPLTLFLGCGVIEALRVRGFFGDKK